jgi:hypothetical protein
VPSAPEIVGDSVYDFEGEAEWGVTLEFTTPLDGGSPIIEYLYSENGGEFQKFETEEDGSPNHGTLNTHVESCNSNLEDHFTVEAVNSVGESLESNSYYVFQSEEEC